jgi:hypothetical protein
MLQGPTPEEGYAVGRKMVSEIKAALSVELRIGWAPEEEVKPGSCISMNASKSTSTGSQS